MAKLSSNSIQLRHLHIEQTRDSSGQGGQLCQCLLCQCLLQRTGEAMVLGRKHSAGLPPPRRQAAKCVTPGSPLRQQFRCGHGHLYSLIIVGDSRVMAGRQAARMTHNTTQAINAPWLVHTGPEDRCSVKLGTNAGNMLGKTRSGNIFTQRDPIPRSQETHFHGKVDSFGVLFMIPCRATAREPLEVDN